MNRKLSPRGHIFHHFTVNTFSKSIVSKQTAEVTLFLYLKKAFAISPVYRRGGDSRINCGRISGRAAKYFLEPTATSAGIAIPPPPPQFVKKAREMRDFWLFPHLFRLNSKKKRRRNTIIGIFPVEFKSHISH